MIFWYSGTGNSHMVAERLGSLLGENVCALIGDEGILSESLRTPASDTDPGSSIGIVFPIYSWGVPPIVLRFVELYAKRLRIVTADRPFWMVCTCGDETGMAPRMFRKSAENAGLKVAGMWSVQMPNNYVMLPGFDVDPVELAEIKLRSCDARIVTIADGIRGLIPGDAEAVEDCVLGSWPRLKSGIVYPLFARWGVFPDKWHATDACTGCGSCSKVCPVHNIAMCSDAGAGHELPKWGDVCLSCTACYHICPVNAVQYGNATKGKGQYSLKGILRLLKAGK